MLYPVSLHYISKICIFGIVCKIVRPFLKKIGHGGLLKLKPKFED